MGSQPATNARPPTATAAPMAMVSHGDTSTTLNEVHDTTAPAAANSTRNPADTAPATNRARPTPAVASPRSSSPGPTASRPRKYER